MLVVGGLAGVVVLGVVVGDVVLGMVVLGVVVLVPVVLVVPGLLPIVPFDVPIGDPGHGLMVAFAVAV